MNAPSFKPPRWQEYRSTVQPIFRRATNEEIELRARLLLLRDTALNAMTYSNEEAYGLLHAVYEMAGRYALLDLTIEQLREMRRILIMATTNASAMQVLANDIHNTWSGGTNAGG